MTLAGHGEMFDRALWGVFLSIAVLGIAIWLGIFECNYHPRIHWYNEDVAIQRVGDSELDFNHPSGGFSMWWQADRPNVRLWPR